MTDDIGIGDVVIVRKTGNVARVRQVIARESRRGPNYGLDPVDQRESAPSRPWWPAKGRRRAWARDVTLHESWQLAEARRRILLASLYEADQEHAADPERVARQLKYAAIALDGARFRNVDHLAALAQVGDALAHAQVRP
jgi:hypothetical protein